MIEVELKFLIKLEQIEDLIKRLQNKAYEISIPRVYEKTVMYDNPQQLMQITDGRIRLRQSGDRVEFCYKKPLTREGVKKEIEYEVEVSDFAMMEKILEQMEFTSTTSYERYRTTLTKDTLKVTIDEYPFNTYIELEGDEQEIKQLAKKLQFDLAQNLTDPCDTLFTQWRQKQGLEPAPHMLFDTFNQ